VIKDVPDKLTEIRKLITELDTPARQVMIDSRVVIASDDYARDIGVRFGVTGVNQTSSGINALSGSLAGTNTIVNSAVDNLTTTGQPFPVAVPPLADRIGELDAMMKPLNDERAALAAQLKELGAGKYAGQLWSCTVSESTRTSVDWKTIAERLNPSRQLVVAHTSQSPVVTLKVTGVK
jgi:hypothetical protein